MTVALLWLVPALIVGARLYIRHLRHRADIKEVAEIAHVEHIHDLHVRVMPVQTRVTAEPVEAGRHRAGGRHRAES